MSELVLTAVHNETPAIRVMTFQRNDGSSIEPYLAGTHIEFDLGELGTRSYSLIDWPNEPRNFYTIAVQKEDEGAGGSKAMHGLQIGDVAKASAPKNDFSLDEAEAPVLLLAGGIGVTPLISMATALQRAEKPFSFHFAARNKAAMGFSEPLQAAFPENMVFHFDDKNPLDLAKLMGGLTCGTHVYICGPKPMIEAARAEAEKNGIADVHVELFETAIAEGADVSFEVEIADTGQIFVIPVGKTIIEVLEECGLDLMYDCQRGDCGICQTNVVEGVPDHRDVVLSEAERASNKIMQICVSRAKSPRLVLDL